MTTQSLNFRKAGSRPPREAPPRHWHRVAGRRTKYHADADDYARSGKAVCGINIYPAAFVAWNREELTEKKLSVCSHCDRILKRKDAK